MPISNEVAERAWGGKRAFDFAIAVVSLPIVLPVVAALCVAVRLETPGSGIFRQERVGVDGKIFTMYKLRTMYLSTGELPSHEVGAAQITSVGRRLRTTKLDELPQIINVVRGDMSFVGPRPCLLSQRELIAERQVRGVLRLRPGITGVAQVAGIDMSSPVKLAESDAAYLRTSSFILDLRLIIATALGSGAGDVVA